MIHNMDTMPNHRHSPLDTNVHDSHSIKVVPWRCRTYAHRKRFKELWRHLCLGEIVIHWIGNSRVMGRLKEFCIPLVFWSAVWMSYASVALGADCSNQLSPILFGKYIKNDYAILWLYLIDTYVANNSIPTNRGSMAFRSQSFRAQSMNQTEFKVCTSN